jgi:hypothetical protein
MVFAGSNWKSPEIPAPLHKHFGEVVEVEVSDNLITVQFTSRKKRLEIGWTPQVGWVILLSYQKTRLIYMYVTGNHECHWSACLCISEIG